MRIDVELSESSIAQAIEKLRKYEKLLQSKLDEYVEALADIGINTINAEVSSIDPEMFGRVPDAKTSKEPGPSQDGHSKMRIRLSGEDVLFIEFSAGITYGTNDYPLPSGKGYGMGTYPSGKGHWDNPHGWYYQDKSSPYAINERGTVHSYGNPAYMPMYHAIEAMTLQIWATAYKIFWTGV